MARRPASRQLVSFDLASSFWYVFFFFFFSVDLRAHQVDATGKLFMQAKWSTILYDYKTQQTTQLPNMPYAVRVYPASAAAVMLPLTPENNYNPTLVFCGGSNPPQWGDDGSARYNVTAVEADNSCVRITPDDENPQYEDDDFLPTGRSMGQFNYLPDGTIWMGNGVHMGTAGYGTEHYSYGQSYGQDPIYAPGVYDPSKPKGSRWRWDFEWSTQERMYHSSVVLLKDGSLLISGSNPNADVETDKWATSYSVERWYPKWYNEERPGNKGFPETLNYGGQYWSMPLNTTDEAAVKSAKVYVIRGGFSTHTVSWGQRFLELETSYEIDPATGKSTLFVSQMPPNAATFTPGPALLFLNINGVPSHGLFVMVGSGKLEEQPIANAIALPQSSTKPLPSSSVESKAPIATGTNPDTPTAKVASKNAGVVSSSCSLVATVAMSLLATFVALA